MGLGGGVGDRRRPGVSAAASSAFSVPITDGSSMKIAHGFSPPSGRETSISRVALDPGAEVLERVEVRVEPAAADEVAAGRRHARLAEAGEQRAGEQEGGPDPADERLVRRRIGDPVGAAGGARCGRSRRALTPRPSSTATWVSVSRIRGTLREHQLLVGQQAGGEDRQRGVLVPGGEISPDRGGPLDHELLHRRGG